MRFLYIDPAIQQVLPIDILIEDFGFPSDEELLLGAYLLHYGFEATLGQAKEMGMMALERSDIVEEARPTFKVHRPILIKSITSLPDLPPEQWACLSCCSDHHITLTNRCLIYGYNIEADRAARITGAQMNLCRLHTHIPAYIIENILTDPTRLQWGKEGTTPLIPVPHTPYGWDWESHFCHTLSASATDDSPTQDEKLRGIFFNKG